VGRGVGRRVGVVDRDVLVAGGDPQRQPDVPAFARLAVEGSVAEGLGERWRVTPDHLALEVEGVDPRHDVGDAVRRGTQGDVDAAGVDPLETREDALGRETGVFPVGYRDDDSGPVGRRWRRRAVEVVECGDTLLDVLHRQGVARVGGKRTRYARASVGRRSVAYSAVRATRTPSGRRTRLPKIAS